MAAGRFADLAGHEVADRGHIEPRAHDERGEERRRQPVHRRQAHGAERSEEHTSELQSLMRISYAVFCLKKKTNQQTQIYQSRNPNAILSPNHNPTKMLN